MQVIESSENHDERGLTMEEGGKLPRVETSQNFKEKEVAMKPYGLKQISIYTGGENGERSPKIELSFSHDADLFPILEAIINTAYPDEVVNGKAQEQNCNS